MKVSMDLLKQLRAASHAPMNYCKDALIEAEGDLEKSAGNPQAERYHQSYQEA